MKATGHLAKDASVTRLSGWKAAMTQVVGFFPLIRETWIEFPAPNFSSGLFQPFGE